MTETRITLSIVVIYLFILILSSAENQKSLIKIAETGSSECGYNKIWRCRTGSGTGGLLTIYALLYNITSDDKIINYYQEILDTASPDCGEKTTWRCRTGLSHVYLLRGLLDGYRVTGDEKYLKYAYNLVEAGSTECGIHGSLSCRSGKTQGLLMLSYLYFYELTGNETLLQYAVMLGDAGALECGIKTDIWSCRSGEDQGLLSMAYFRLYEVTYDKKYLSALYNLLNTGTSACSPENPTCDTAISWAYMILAYIYAEPVFDSEGIIHVFLNHTPAECGPEFGWRCQTAETLSVMIYLYNLLGYNYTDNFLEAGSRECGASTGWRCLSAYSQLNLFFAYMETIFPAQFFRCPPGRIYCGNTCIKKLNYVGMGGICSCDEECHELVCVNNHCCQKDAIYCNLTGTCEKRGKKEGEACGCNDACESGLCVGVCVEKESKLYGENCTVDEECIKPYYCVENICIRKNLTEAESCIYDRECRSGICDKNHCCPLESPRWCGEQCKSSCATPTPLPVATVEEVAIVTAVQKMNLTITPTSVVISPRGSLGIYGKDNNTGGNMSVNNTDTLVEEEFVEATKSQQITYYLFFILVLVIIFLIWIFSNKQFQKKLEDKHDTTESMGFIRRDMPTKDKIESDMYEKILVEKCQESISDMITYICQNFDNLADKKAFVIEKALELLRKKDIYDQSVAAGIERLIADKKVPVDELMKFIRERFDKIREDDVDTEKIPKKINMLFRYAEVVRNIDDSAAHLFREEACEEFIKLYPRLFNSDRKVAEKLYSDVYDYLDETESDLAKKLEQKIVIDDSIEKNNIEGEEK